MGVWGVVMVVFVRDLLGVVGGLGVEGVLGSGALLRMILGGILWLFEGGFLWEGRGIWNFRELEGVFVCKRHGEGFGGYLGPVYG